MNRNWTTPVLVELIVILVIGLIGAMLYPGVHKFLFEMGGFIIIILGLILSIVQGSSRRPPSGKPQIFWDDDDDDQSPF